LGGLLTVGVVWKAILIKKVKEEEEEEEDKW